MTVKKFECFITSQNISKSAIKRLRLIADGSNKITERFDLVQAMLSTPIFEQVLNQGFQTFANPHRLFLNWKKKQQIMSKKRRGPRNMFSRPLTCELIKQNIQNAFLRPNPSPNKYYTFAGIEDPPKLTFFIFLISGWKRYCIFLERHFHPLR